MRRYSQIATIIKLPKWLALFIGILPVYSQNAKLGGLIPPTLRELERYQIRFENRFGDLIQTESFSISHNLPSPRDQRPFNSCVAWSLGYAFMTSELWKGRLPKVQSAEVSAIPTDSLSPSFLYWNAINDKSRILLTSLQSGGPDLSFEDVFTSIQKNGICFFKDYESPLVAPSETTVNKAKKFACGFSLGSIEPQEAARAIDTVKSWLVETLSPVPFGIEMDDMLRQKTNFKKSAPNSKGELIPVWDEFLQLDSESEYPCHAMVITGWDNRLQCFEILNSSHTGYMWLSYKMFQNQAICAWKVKTLPEVSKAGKISFGSGTSSHPKLRSAIAQKPKFYCKLAEKIDLTGEFTQRFFDISGTGIESGNIPSNSVLRLRPNTSVYKRSNIPRYQVGRGLVWPQTIRDGSLLYPQAVRVIELVSYTVNPEHVKGTVTHYWIGCTDLE